MSSIVAFVIDAPFIISVVLTYSTFVTALVHGMYFPLMYDLLASLVYNT